MWSKKSGVSVRSCCQSFCQHCKPIFYSCNNLNSYKSIAINLLENINHFPKGFWWATCSNNVTRLNEGNQTSEEHCMRWLMPRWFVILIHWFQGVREANFWNLFWGENWRNYKRVEQATGLFILGGASSPDGFSYDAVAKSDDGTSAQYAYQTWIQVSLNFWKFFEAWCYG